ARPGGDAALERDGNAGGPRRCGGRGGVSLLGPGARRLRGDAAGRRRASFDRPLLRLRRRGAVGEGMSWADILAAIQTTELSQAIRYSQWRYAAVNTAHIFGIALLVGAILPMDLRLIGAFRRIPHSELARVLVPMAALGLALAITAGVGLFVVRAKEY